MREPASKVFSGNLAPLESLVTVEGALALGRGVDSLVGLGGLARAGALILEQSEVESLLGLGPELALTGEGLLLVDNPQLRSLRGVPALNPGVSVIVRGNPVLSDGLALELPERVASIELVSNPSLSSLSVLGVRSVASRAHVQEVALEDLSAFSGLGHCAPEGVGEFASEPIVIDAAGLASLSGLESLEAVDLLRLVGTSSRL